MPLDFPFSRLSFSQSGGEPHTHKANLWGNRIHWEITSYVTTPASQSNKLVGGLAKWIVLGKRRVLLFLAADCRAFQEICACAPRSLHIITMKI